MRKLRKILFGFALALIGAVIIHGGFLKKRTDIYSFAYCAPQSIASPIFLLNMMAYMGELDFRERAKSSSRNHPNGAKVFFLSSAYSGALTLLFWLPFLIPSRKVELSPKPEKENLIDD